MRSNLLKNTLWSLTKAILGPGWKTMHGDYTPSMSHETKVVYLPRLPLGEVDDKLAKLFLGWLAHEHCHKHTDAGVMPYIQKDKRVEASQKQLYKGLLNAIEDPRCERDGIRVLPGIDMELRERLEVMIEEGRIKKPESSPATALQMYCCHYGRIFLLGHNELKTTYEEARAEMQKLIGDNGLKRLDALLSMRYPSLSDAWEAYELTHEVLDLIEEIAEEQKEEQEEDKSEQSQDGEDESDDSGDSDDNSDEGEEGEQSSSGGESGDSEEDGDDQSSPSCDGEGDSDDESDDQSSGSSGEGEEGKDDGQSQGAGDGAQQILDDQDVEEEPDDLAQMLQQAIEEEVERQAEEAGVSTNAAGAHSGAGMSPSAVPENLNRYNEAVKETSGQMATIKSRVKALLSARERSRKVVSRRGKISRRHLARVPTGSQHVYQRKVTETPPVKSVSILVDHSGSMDGPREELAQQSLIALSEACDAANVPFEILGFGAGTAHPAGLIEVKPFGVNFRNAKPALGGYIAVQKGGTPMGEGMFDAGMRLVRQRSAGHILIVLTDGSPHNGEYAKMVIHQLERLGVQVIGVGIQSSAVEHYFNTYSVVNNLENLGTELLDLIKNAILSEAA